MSSIEDFSQMLSDLIDARDKLREEKSCLARKCSELQIALSYTSRDLGQREETEGLRQKIRKVEEENEALRKELEKANISREMMSNTVRTLGSRLAEIREIVELP